MSDQQIRELERRVANGDDDAQALLDAAILRICEHKGEQYLATLGSLWTEGHMWCTECGTCMSKPDEEPRAAQARSNRDMREAFKKHRAKMAAMTDDERAAWQEELTTKINKRLQEHRESGRYSFTRARSRR